ncbi:X-ray radiation resistance-associated protein 1 isoform X2 [Xenopus laevis]|uniref:X-ray radiation resistance-associated protein 1 isoform X2 n=1 Tax=Xenopus laevis TaxID=8355 RepID=A0A8J1MBJ3_XENLA|nr:X-ray radiation resistance-associated protein 1 isoform X2 [Xenopus laevis]
MAASWLYRMDTGDLFTSNSFPARSLLQSNHRGGRWVKTQRVWSNGRIKLVKSAASSTFRSNQDTVLTEPTSSGSSSLNHQQNVLNTSFLLKTHYVKTPADLCSVDVSDRNLTSAQEEELVQFNCVVYINAAENSLTLGTFRSFSALRELDLSMNNIRNVCLEPGDLPKLEVLDLCYNNLTPDDVTRLGVLSHLRVLHLSGNGLTHLPPDMSVSHMLRLLNLDNNSISGIPYLYPADTTPRNNPPNKECEEKGAEDGLKTFHYTVIPSKDDPDRTEVIFTDQENSQKDDHVTKASDATESFRFHSHMSEDGSSQALVPLPSLRYLSLANNKIRHQEKLLAAALFPSLEELVIHGNPLTTLRKGDPPLLSDVLQQRLGIHITTKKPPEIRKLPLFIPVNEGRKVQSVIPKVPKQPLIVEPPFSPKLPFDRRHPLSDGKEFTPLPPITPSSERRSQDSEQSSEMTVEVETSSGSGDAAESIFMTQVDDLPESAHVSQSGSPSQPEAEEEEEEEEEIPKKFKGYEELFHVQTDPEFIDPVGIQSNVRALQNALSHLLVYRDSKPRLSGLHKPYIPTESKVGKLLTPLPRKDKKEILGEILAGMRESRNLSQVPLNSILGQKQPTLEKREAQTLLRELQFRYKALQAESATRAQEMERCSGRAGATVDNKWNAGNVTDPSTQN